MNLNELKTVAKIPGLITARQFASKAVSIIRDEKKLKPNQSSESNFRDTSKVIQMLEKEGVWQIWQI